MKFLFKFSLKEISIFLSWKLTKLTLFSSSNFNSNSFLFYIHQANLQMILFHTFCLIFHLLLDDLGLLEWKT